MVSYVDLSHPIRSGMQVYPGDPQVEIAPSLTISDDGVAVVAVHLGSHTGTHIDAPSHSVEGGRTMSAVHLDELSGMAAVIRISGLSAGEEIAFSRFSDQVGDDLPPIVIIATGWDRSFGTGDYLDHPYLAPDAAAELSGRGMRVLGMDTLSPDRTLQEEGSFQLPVHDLILGGNGLIIENLRGVTELPDRCWLGLFPLPLQDTDGAPVRAVARMDG